MADDPVTLEQLVNQARRGDTSTFESDEPSIEERRAVAIHYGGLFTATTELFFALDPVGINFGSNADEYEPEVGTVLPRLEAAGFVDDVARILREEFGAWFGAAFDGRSIDRLAPQLWTLWQAWKRSRD